MKTLTFALDVQLNDNEDWIKEGTVVEVYDNPNYLNRHIGYTPVIIKEAYDLDGNRIKINPTYEWL